MKQNYIFCLVGILSIWNAVFSMEVPPEVQAFNTAYTEALKFETDGEMDKALVEYGKAANIKLPEAGFGIGGYRLADKYSEERKKQTIAIEKLEKEAEPLKAANKIKEVLKIYESAPDVFEGEIEFFKEISKAELARAQTDIFDNVQNLIGQGKYPEAAIILEKVIENENQKEYDVVIEEAKKLLDTITKASEKTLISALHNLKNGFVQVGNKIAST